MTLSPAVREAAKHTCVVDRIGSGNIDNLEIHFERSTAPILIHTSLAGMNPSCQVSLLVLHEKVHVKMLAFACLNPLPLILF